MQAICCYIRNTYLFAYLLLPEQAQCNVVFLSIFLYVIWKKALYDQLERTTIQLIKNLKLLLQFNLGYISRDKYWLASVQISWMWSRRLLLKAYKFGVKRDSIMMVISVSRTIGFKLYHCINATLILDTFALTSAK